MVEILVPIFVCVVLPVMVVFIYSHYNNKNIESKMKVLTKAIENGQDIDPELFAEKKNQKSARQRLLGNLQGGVICGIMGIGLTVLSFCISHNTDFFLVAGIILLAVGIGLLVGFAVGRKLLAKELDD